MNIFSWLHSLTDWIQNRFQAAESKPNEPIYLDEFHSKDHHGYLRLIYDQQRFSPMPGVVSVWEVDHISSQVRYVLILCNLAQIREYLSGRKLPKTHHDPDWNQLLEIKARQAIREQSDILGSHILLVLSISKQPNRQLLRTEGPIMIRQIDCLCCHIVNLQGEFRAILSANADAQAIIKIIGLKLMVLKPTRLNKWEEFVTVVPWLDWLEFFAKKRFGKDHVLQPRRAKISTTRTF